MTRPAENRAPTVIREAGTVEGGMVLSEAMRRWGAQAALASAGIVLRVVRKLQAHGLVGPRGLSVTLRVFSVLTAISHRQWRRRKGPRPPGHADSDSNDRELRRRRP